MRRLLLLLLLRRQPMALPPPEPTGRPGSSRPAARAAKPPRPEPPPKPRANHPRRQTEGRRRPRRGRAQSHEPAKRRPAREVAPLAPATGTATTDTDTRASRCRRRDTSPTTTRCAALSVPREAPSWSPRSPSSRASWPKPESAPERDLSKTCFRACRAEGTRPATRPARPRRGRPPDDAIRPSGSATRPPDDAFRPAPRAT